jgi:hypothetical protein
MTPSTCSSSEAGTGEVTLNNMANCPSGRKNGVSAPFYVSCAGGYYMLAAHAPEYDCFSINLVSQRGSYRS